MPPKRHPRAGEVVFDFDTDRVVLPNIHAHGYRLKQPIGFLAKHLEPKRKRKPTKKKPPVGRLKGARGGGR